MDFRIALSLAMFASNEKCAQEMSPCLSGMICQVFPSTLLTMHLKYEHVMKNKQFHVKVVDRLGILPR